MKLRNVVILLVGAIGGALSADEVQVTSVVHGQPQVESMKVQLRAVRIDGTGTPEERLITIPGTAAIELTPGNWELSVHSPRFWTAPTVASTGRPHTIDLWPAGIIRATLEAARGETVRDVHLNFAPPDEIQGVAPTGDSVCSAEGNAWSCVVPAGTLDLKLLVRGFAAVFRWQQKIGVAEKTDLGVLRLFRGASLSGFVSAGRGVDVNLKGAVVSAIPRSVSSTPSPRKYTTTASARGFFQIAGLPAGEYVVHAEVKRFRSEDRAATILEERNAELRAPLVLDLPKKLFLVISSPSTEPWRLSLSRGAEVFTAVAGIDGTWSTDVLPGQYFLKIGRTDGSVWAALSIVVESDDVRITLSIPVTNVVGSVKLGNEALRGARLIFGGTRTSEQQTLVTDRDGRFSGQLPAKENAEEKWVITIESDAHQVQRTADFEGVEHEGTIRFDIKLPKTTLKGRAVNEDGTAGVGAVVTLASPDDRLLEQAFARDDGTFEIYGFEPGIYRVQADSFQKTSDIMTIEAAESDGSEIELVLRSDTYVRGRVRSRSTPGIEAKLTALPRDVRSSFVPQTTTDSDGGFELKLPPMTRAFDLIVDPPGFALAMGRVNIQPDKFLTLTSDQIGGKLAMEIPSGVETVVRHDGAEFPARWLVASFKGTVESKDGWDVATLPNVEAGQYSVCANGRCQTGIVTPNGSAVLSLR